ncbi:hypothetical protein TRICI_001621 [Trichomonascus ciferrii]|uniref:UBX domain-containing protein n=1 Tax=Trichomonascus ciferrii TaxID=44093 RepID=A0A642VCH6_9ASCO|nr:hypothetical protein TRICI_001621 [Trichomonascus ciferrii]
MSRMNITQRSVDKGSVKVYEMPQIQLFNTILTKLEELDQPLENVGLTSGNSLMRIRFESAAMSLEKALEIQQAFATPDIPPAQSSLPKEESSSQTESAATTPPTPAENGAHPSETRAEPSVSRKVQAYLPAEGTREIPDDAPGEEMSPAQFRKYRSQLSSLSGSDKKDSPLMTAAMREQKAAQRLPKVTECAVRVRLPDQTQVEGKFQPNEPVSELYRFVKSVLRNPDLPFLLFMFPPRRVLGDPTSTLANDCNFGSRELVYLEWDVGAGTEYTADSFPRTNILNDSALQTAKPITEDESIKIDQMQPLSDEAKEQPQQPSTTSSEKQKPANGKPKWFKLGRR